MIYIKEQEKEVIDNTKANNWDCVEEEYNDRMSKDDRDEEWD